MGGYINRLKCPCQQFHLNTASPLIVRAQKYGSHSNQARDYDTRLFELPIFLPTLH